MQRNAGGRPPTPGLTEALLQAAERIMVNEGIGNLTVDRLVNEVGTTRPTFYRRYSSIASLAFEVIRRRFGTGAHVNTGSLEQDLLTLQREDIAMLSSPLLQRNLPGLLVTVGVDSAVRNSYRNEFIEPRRANVRDLVLAAVDRGEIPGTNTDVEYICDLLLGPLLARTLLPLDGSLDDHLARATVRTAMEHLMSTSSAPGALSSTTWSSR